MNSIELSDTLSLPVDVATEAVAVLGRRGKGKTNTAGVIVEDLVTLGVPVVVVDTVGVWWGLRTSQDGTGPGIPIVIIGGSHADLPLEETAGRTIAAAIVERRFSAVLDTSLLSKAAARRFLTDLVTELYHRNRSPMHVVFDEADELAPQKPGAEGAKLLGAMQDFVRRGRARGLGCTLVTQRPAVLNKDVLTQIEVLVAHGMTGPRDVAAIDEWVRLHADEAEAKQVKSSLASLPTGTAWVWSPAWLEILQQVKVRARRTFDSSATPKVGMTLTTPVARAEVDLAELGAAIASGADVDVVEDPAVLHARIAQLQRDLAARPEVVAPVTVEVPTLTDGDRGRLASAHQALVDVATQVAQLERTVSDATATIADVTTTAAPADRHAPPAPTPTPTPTPAPAPVSAPAQREEPDPTRSPAAASGLGKAERAILSTLATYGPRSHVQIAQLAGYSSKGGGFANALGRLRSSGRIDGGRSQMQITDRGRADLGPVESLPTGPALVEHWLGRLGKAERAILEVLVSVWPASRSHEEIAAATGYASAGGGFANALGHLRSLELISGTRAANTAADALGSAAQGATHA